LGVSRPKAEHQGEDERAMTHHGGNLTPTVRGC
jgi:hypothetical protein